MAEICSSGSSPISVSLAAWGKTPQVSTEIPESPNRVGTLTHIKGTHRSRATCHWRGQFVYVDGARAPHGGGGVLDRHGPRRSILWPRFRSVGQAGMTVTPRPIVPCGLRRSRAPGSGQPWISTMSQMMSLASGSSLAVAGRTCAIRLSLAHDCCSNGSLSLSASPAKYICVINRFTLPVMSK